MSLSRRSMIGAFAGMVAAPWLTLAEQMRELGKSLVLLWMNGGPSTIDLWDLKPAAKGGGPFRPIPTSAEAEICEHLPLTAQQMHHLSIVRSMNTREEDHTRARYYMHTAHLPQRGVEHPGYGAVVAQETRPLRKAEDLPPYIAIGGGGAAPGFLGVEYSALPVDYRGAIAGVDVAADPGVLGSRLEALERLEEVLSRRDRGRSPQNHLLLLYRTMDLLLSPKRSAFDLSLEPEAVRRRYGESDFGRGCLLARRLIEAGVPCIELVFHGWDTHADIFRHLQERLLPPLDQGMSALIDDLHQRGLLQQTVVLWLGEFGRSPHLNARGGRDHWARAWSVVLGGGGLRGGIVVGRTSDDGSTVETQPYSSENLMATVLRALGVPLDRVYTGPAGQEIRIAGGGQPIAPLLES